MEGSSNGSCSYVMGAFGENSGGLCPPMMMMPLVTSSHHNAHHPINSNNNNNNNNNTNANNTTGLFLPIPNSTNNNNNHYTNCNNNTSSIMLQNNHQNTPGLGYYFMDNINNHGSSSSSSSSVKSKIMAHPHYHRLLEAYINCQKVGAPSEVVARLEEACATAVRMGGDAVGSGCLGEDPALDQFMEAYCEMLIKYEQELSKPLKEAMLFLQRIEVQFKNLTVSSSSDNIACSEGGDRNGSSEEDHVDLYNNMIDPQAEDRELKGQLLRKYSGYLGSLKQEFMKKRKKGKLPKEARQQLLEWWSRHYKWPYPSESQKLALAESTGLDQKQINNWFINQRKRHWKPSEDMQFVVMDPSHPHYYMDNVLTNSYPMDLSNTML